MIILYNSEDRHAPRARAARQIPLKSRFDLICNTVCHLRKSDIGFRELARDSIDFKELNPNGFQYIR